MDNVPIIPLAFLDNKGACNDDYEIVAEEWPNGIPITLESYLRAVELGVDINWIIGRLPSYLEQEYNQEWRKTRVEKDKEMRIVRQPFVAQREEIFDAAVGRALTKEEDDRLETLAKARNTATKAVRDEYNKKIGALMVKYLSRHFKEKS